MEISRRVIFGGGGHGQDKTVIKHKIFRKKRKLNYKEG